MFSCTVICFGCIFLLVCSDASLETFLISQRSSASVLIFDNMDQPIQLHKDSQKSQLNVAACKIGAILNQNYHLGFKSLSSISFFPSLFLAFCINFYKVLILSSSAFHIYIQDKGHDALRQTVTLYHDIFWYPIQISLVLVFANIFDNFQVQC